MDRQYIMTNTISIFPNILVTPDYTFSTNVVISHVLTSRASHITRRSSFHVRSDLHR